MSPRPKYTAAQAFSTAGHHFAEGDPVENLVVLDAVLRHGDQFVTTNTKRATRTDTPTTSAAAESPKEQ